MLTGVLCTKYCEYSFSLPGQQQGFCLEIAILMDTDCRRRMYVVRENERSRGTYTVYIYLRTLECASCCLHDASGGYISTYWHCTQAPMQAPDKYIISLPNEQQPSYDT